MGFPIRSPPGKEMDVTQSDGQVLHDGPLASQLPRASGPRTVLSPTRSSKMEKSSAPDSPMGSSLSQPEDRTMVNGPQDLFVVRVPLRSTSPLASGFVTMSSFVVSTVS